MKSRYIMENQTGMIIEVKQRGTPGLDPLEQDPVRIDTSKPLIPARSRVM